MFKAITPRFINNIDAFLLINHPILWMSKIHYVLWHGLTIWFLSALLGLVLPIDLTQRIEYEIWYFLFTVLTLVVFCFWVFRYLIFNKSKNYGSRKFSDEYKNFFLVFSSVTIFLLVPWPFELIYSQRIANMYSNEEVLQDMDQLNQSDPYLVHSTNNYYSWYDSTSNIQYLNIRKLNPYGSSYYTPYFMKSDSAKFPELRTEFQLSRSYKAIGDVQFLQQKIDKYIAIAKKYNIEINISTDETIKRYIDFLSKEKITVSEFSSYGSYQYDLSTTFNNLCEAKFKTLFIFTSDYLWVIFYFIITITSFLLLFKMTNWQQYLIMIVVLFLYPLVMFIFSQLLPYSGIFKGTTFFELSLLALILFSGITLFISSNEKHEFKPFFNIMNQIFYATILFSPMLVIAFLHDNTNIFHNHDYMPQYSNPYNMKHAETVVSMTYDTTLEGFYWKYWNDEYLRWINIMKYAGIIIFLIALPFFNNLFIKQLSLPKKT